MKGRLIKQKAVFQIFLVITLAFFTANIISKDARAVETAGCCLDAGNGQYCVNVGSSSQCISGFKSGIDCSSDTECGNKGCCNKLSDDGSCSGGVPKAACENQNGIWSSDPLCGSDLECQPKCCIIGSEWRLDYKKNCDYYNGIFLEGVTSAGECASQVSNINEGCCKYNNEKDFSFTTGSDCNGLNGIFFENTVCNNVAGYSDSNYKSHKEAKCGPEGTSKIEDVYWYDSAGNLEEIKYNCDSDNLQTATQCGDSDNNGEYTCESLDCASTWDNPVVEGDGGSRNNGESWCEYQSAAGPGADLPGTRHFRHKCERGKEIVEACDDGRDQICIQNDINYGGSKMSMGKCVDNPGEECLSFTIEGEGKCAENNCIWAGSRCLPLSPPSNFLSEETNDYCGEINMELQTAWKKKCGGKWKCAGNCQAYTDDSLTKFSNYCNTLGDCGAKFNLAGVYSNKGVARWASGSVPCYNNPPEYYYNFNTAMKAGKGLFGGEVSFNQDEAGGLTGRQLLAFTLNTFGNEDYLPEANIGEMLTAGGWNMLGNVLLSASAGAGAGLLVAIYVSTKIGAKVGGLLGTAIPVIGTVIGAIIGALVGALIGYFVFKVLPQLSGCPKTDEKTVNFGCGAWKPPKGGADCEKCQKKVSEGGLLPDYKFGNEHAYECTEQLCKSLGTWCEYDYTAYNCLKVDPQDLFAPSISIDKSITKYYCNNELPGDVTECNEDANQGINVVIESGREKGAEIKGEIIDIYEAGINKKTPVITLGIKTDEGSICKYDLSDKPYDEMGYSFSSEDTNTRSTQHNITLPNNNLILTDSCGEYNLYVQCEDFKGNKGNLLEDQSYVIKFKAAKQPDVSPVLIDENKINPLSGSYVKYGDKEKSIEIQLAEPAQCRWSREENVNYDDMANEFSCSGATLVQTIETPQAGLTQEDLEGETDADMCDPALRLTCETTLTNITAGENKFYFKCEDANGNVNTQDWPQIGIQRGYVLYGSSGNLTISETNCIHALPNGETKTECGDIYALNYTLRLKTDGGMNGEADCKYGFNTAPNINFFSTGKKEHTQLFAPLNGLPEGQHIVNVECKDRAGNVISKEITNNIKADRTAPRMERVYLDGSYLVLETNEKSACKFTNINLFDYSKASVMASVNGLVHRATKDKDFYKIGCIDIFGNSMSPVSVSIIGEKVTVG